MADEFDPDAYLARPQAQPEFDPDAYLKTAPAPQDRGVLERAGSAVADTFSSGVEAAKKAVVPPSKKEAAEHLGPSGMWKSFKETGEALLSPFTTTVGAGLAAPQSLIASGMAGITPGKETSEQKYEEWYPKVGTALTALGPKTAPSKVTGLPELVPKTARVPKGAEAQTEAEAARYLEGEAHDPAKMKADLATAQREIVPGSQPSTFQLTRDPGLGPAEMAAETRNSAEFRVLREQQNEARIKALEEIQRTGSPQEATQALRDALRAEEANAQQAVQLARQRAWEASQQVGGTYDATLYGNVFRRELMEAEEIARANERRLWNAVDPDGTLSVNPQRLQELERGVYGNLSDAAVASLTPAENTLIRLIQNYRPVTPFREMTDLRSLTSGYLREELYTRGQTPAYARLSRLRQGIEEAVNNSFTEAGEGAAGAADRLRAASAATRERVETFRPLRAVTKREGVAGPYQMGTASVPERIVQSGPKGYDSVSGYLRAVGNERGLPELQDAVAAKMRARVMPNGVVDPGALETWLRQHQGALRAIDELDGGAFSQRLRNAGTAQEALVRAEASQAERIKAQGKDEFKKLVGLVDDADIAKTLGGLFEHNNPVQMARSLMSRLSASRAAQEGARRAIIEHMQSRFSSNAPTTTGNPMLRAEQLQNFIKRNEEALRVFFSPQQVDQLRALVQDLQRMNLTVGTKVRGRSSTPQEFVIAEQQQKRLRNIAGFVVDAAIDAGLMHLGVPWPIKTTTRLLQKGFRGRTAEQQAEHVGNLQRIVDKAMRDPDFANQLFNKTATLQRTPNGWKVVGYQAGVQSNEAGSQQRTSREAGGGVPAIGGTGGQSQGATTPAGARAARQGAGQALQDGGAARHQEANPSFETKLKPGEEKAFQAWKKKYAPNDSGEDYDYRGAFKAKIKPHPDTLHWPDTYKKPNHPTFSNESQYAKDRPELAGRWEGNTYVPSQWGPGVQEGEYDPSGSGTTYSGGFMKFEPNPQTGEQEDKWQAPNPGGMVMPPQSPRMPTYNWNPDTVERPRENVYADGGEVQPQPGLRERWGSAQTGSIAGGGELTGGGGGAKPSKGLTPLLRQDIVNTLRRHGIDDKEVLSGWADARTTVDSRARGGGVDAPNPPPPPERLDPSEQDTFGSRFGRWDSLMGGMVPRDEEEDDERRYEGSRPMLPNEEFINDSGQGRYDSGWNITRGLEEGGSVDDQDRWQRLPRSRNIEDRRGEDMSIGQVIAAGNPYAYVNPYRTPRNRPPVAVSAHGYAEGGDVEDEKLPLPGQSLGLGRPSDEPLPAMKRNKAGETLPTFVLKEWGKGLGHLAGTPGRVYREGMTDEDVEFGPQMGMLMVGAGGTPAGALGSGMRGRGRGPRVPPPKLQAGEIPGSDRPVTRGHNMPPEEEALPPPPVRATSSLGLRDMPLDKAIEVARTERHIIPSNPKVREGYVGAPDWVKTTEDLAQMRANFDAQVARGMGGADWYERAQGGVKEMAGPDPKRQHRLAQEKAVTSAQATPDTNLGFALQGHNAILTGRPLDIVRTGQVAEAMKKGHATGEIPLGDKTGIYARHLDPTMENPSTGTNDIWHARSWGYENPEGGLKPHQHAFMDAETVLAADRANKIRLGGRDNWTAGEIQASPWVAGKGEGLQEQFGWSPEKAAREATKTYPDYFDKYTAFGTHEATPGVGTRHLPQVAEGSEATRRAFAEDPRSFWRDPSGRDKLDMGLDMWTRPSTRSTGIYEGPKGLEVNPAEVARPMVGFTGKPGARTIDPASRKLMDAAEAARAYVDVQNAGAWSIPIQGQKAGLSQSLYVPRPGGPSPLPIEDVGRLQAIGGRHGLPGVIDYGQGTAMTSFGEPPPSLGKALRGGQLDEVGQILGGEPRLTKLDTGYIDYQSLWGKKEGTGAVTRELKKYLARKDAPDVIRRFDASPEIRQAVLARMERDAELAARTGQPIRADVQRARQIISESGFVGLFDALKRGVALPALAFAPLVQLLMQEQSRPVE